MGVRGKLVEREFERESTVMRFGLQSSLECEQVWSHTETKKGREEEKVFNCRDDDKSQQT